MTRLISLCALAMLGALAPAAYAADPVPDSSYAVRLYTPPGYSAPISAYAPGAVMMMWNGTGYCVVGASNCSVPVSGISGGGGGTGASGSVTSAGTNGSSAQAVQGITGGVPQPVSATSLPLPANAAQASLQPALNGDGGSLAHITNLPTTQPISASALPLPAGAAQASLQPALNGDGGSLAHITNLPATQPVSATSLPLPPNAAQASLQPALNGDGGSLAHITNFPTTQPVSGSVAATNTDFGPEGAKATFVASFLITPSAAQGVFGQIQGSASCVIRIRSISIRAVAAATAAPLSFAITKASSATTGGTSSAVTTTKLDSSSAADCATVLSYATLGTAGTSLGQIDTTPYYIGVGANAAPAYVVQFGQSGGTAALLRNASEYLQFSNGTAAFSANTSLAVNITYTRE